MRRLGSVLGSPLVLALLTVLIFSIPKPLSLLFDVIADIFFDAANHPPFQESIAVAGFCIAIVRSDRRIPFVSLLMMATIFFSGLIAGAWVCRLVLDKLTAVTEGFPGAIPPIEVSTGLGPNRTILLAGLAGGLVAGLVMFAWRWVPGMVRKPLLGRLPWVVASGLIWAASYYLFEKLEMSWLTVSAASCYGFVMFRSMGGSQLLWFSRHRWHGEASSGDEESANSVQ